MEDYTLISKLKILTPEQCVKIATMAYPKIQWKIIIPKFKFKWDGFDLVGVAYDESDIEPVQNIFQIDYREGSDSRFRFYENLFEYELNSVQIEEIMNYINSI